MFSSCFFYLQYVGGITLIDDVTSFSVSTLLFPCSAFSLLKSSPYVVIPSFTPLMLTPLNTFPDPKFTPLSLLLLFVALGLIV